MNSRSGIMTGACRSIFAILSVVVASTAAASIAVVAADTMTAIDLSHGYRNHTTSCWDADDRFRVYDEITETTATGWYATRSVSFSEHCGTHLDAPFHFNAGGWKLDEIPMERTIVEGDDGATKPAF